MPKVHRREAAWALTAWAGRSSRGVSRLGARPLHLGCPAARPPFGSGLNAEGSAQRCAHARLRAEQIAQDEGCSWPLLVLRTAGGLPQPPSALALSPKGAPSAVRSASACASLDEVRRVPRR